MAVRKSDHVAEAFSGREFDLRSSSSKLQKSTKDKTIQIRISEELLELMNREASEKQIAISQLVRMAIVEHLNRRR